LTPPPSVSWFSNTPAGIGLIMMNFEFAKKDELGNISKKRSTDYFLILEDKILQKSWVLTIINFV